MILTITLYRTITAIITALRNLQDKIKDLEIERTTAEKNLQSLAQESEPHKKVLQDRRPAQNKRTQQDKQTEDRGEIFLTQTRSMIYFRLVI